MRRSVVILCVLCLGSCGDPGQREADDGRAPGDPSGAPRYATHLEDAAAVKALAVGDLSVKYLAPVVPGTLAAPVDQPCVFQDMRDTAWHVEFLQGFPDFAALTFEAYLDLVLRRASRVLWGGTVRWWPDATHPETGQAGLLSFSVYADEAPGDRLTVADVVEVHQRLDGCTGFGAHRLVFVAEGPIQADLIAAEATAFDEAGIATAEPSTLAGGQTEVYSEGVGYGTLRVGEPAEFVPGPRDVWVVASAPNDIGVVAGLVTSQPQNLHSHVNLRLGEKGVPNARVPGAPDRGGWLALRGRLVRIEASGETVEIVAAELGDAEAWWADHRPDVGQPSANLDVDDVRPFSAMGAEDADAFGAKAANLAELWVHFGPDHAPNGFAIPFSAYRAHLDANGVDPLIDSFLRDPRRHTDDAWRRQKLDDIRDAIRDGAVDLALLRTLEARIREWLGPDAETTRLRFRSSTNVEDLEALTGAGLYDSKSGCLGDDLDDDTDGPSRCLGPEESAALRESLTEHRRALAAHPEQRWREAVIADIEGDLSEERGLARALVRVWRSLWNDRAWQEREYYGIDHHRAYMGVAVNASFVLERINAVVVTNLEPGSEGPVYRVVSQVAPESVVRPDDPASTAEVRTVRRGPDDTLVDDTRWVDASASPGRPVWEDFDALLQLVFRVHDHFAQTVYADPHAQFDMEVKRTADGRIVVKQIRPYVTGEP